MYDRVKQNAPPRVLHPRSRWCGRWRVQGEMRATKQTEAGIVKSLTAHRISLSLFLSSFLLLMRMVYYKAAQLALPTPDNRDES